MKRTVVLSLLLALLPPSLVLGAPRQLTVDGRTYVIAGDCSANSYSIRLALAPPGGREQMTRLSVLFAADDRGNGYRFEADADGWALSDVADGGTRGLARGDRSPLPSGEPVTLLIKRRDWLLTVAADGRVLAEVADASHFAGLVAVDPLSSSPAARPTVQPVGDLKFEDGFMRPQEKLNLDTWDLAGGQWRLHSVREDSDDMPWQTRPESKQPQSERSANPFTVVGHADGTGMLLTKGHWFWDDYRAGVAVINTGAEAVGLAFNVVAPDDYFVLRWSEWSPLREPTCIRLLRVRGDVIAGQAYRLEVRTRGQRIRAYVDEAVILDVRHPESLGGRIGLYVAGGDKDHVGMFDDVLVASLDGYDYDDKVWLGRHLAASEGRWVYRSVPRPARPDNYAAVLSSEDGQVIVGHTGWGPPLFSGLLSVPGVGQQVGLAAGIGADGKGGYRLVLSREEAGPRLSLHRTGPEAGELASCSDFELPDGGLVALAIDLTRPGECNALLDGRLRLHVPRNDAGSGAVAFFASDFAGAEFRDLRVAFERTEDAERLPRKDLFVTDPFMKHWSSPEGGWWPADNDDVNLASSWWHVGDFYGRSDIDLPFDTRVVIAHAAEKLGRTSGYALIQEQPADPQRPGAYKLTLLRNGEPVASGTAVPPPGRPLTLHKDTPYLWVTVDGTEVLSFRDADPLPGSRVALTGLGRAGLAKVALRRLNVRDEYFETAATDWYRVGEWKVTTRFSCDPRWSFMAGLATQNAVLFNKYSYEGDVTLEAYMGMRMDSRGRGTYVRVGDLNFALCAKPLSLDSGYNFIVAGWDRHASDSRTYLLKGQRLLAESYERLLPNVRRKDTSTRVLPTPWISKGRDIHGAWYYIKARKQGNKLSYYVDNHLVFEAQDEAPLQVCIPAVWTYSADVVVARVKVSYQKRTVPGLLVAPPLARDEPHMLETPAPLIVSETHPGFFDDFEGGPRGWTTYKQQSSALRIVTSSRPDGGNCLQVANPGVGGLFDAVAPVRDARIRVENVRWLTFDYRMDPGVKINLYVRIDEQYYYVHLNGPDRADAFYLRLGELPVEADGLWHRAAFRLGPAFRNLGLKGQLATLAFGNLHRGALQMGIGGNGAGLAYSLDNVKIISGGGAEFRAACRATDIPSGAAVLNAVDDRAATVPVSEGPFQAHADRPGQWTGHARVRFADGQLGPVAHLPFLVATQPVRMEAVRPAAGTRWPCGPIDIDLGPSDSAHLNADSLRLTVNGKSVRTHKGLFDVDWVESVLRIDLKAAGLEFSDGEAVALDLTYADEAGRAGSFHAEYVAAVSEDRTPPTRVTLDGFAPAQDFESDLGSWTVRQNVALMRDNTTAASGDWSLMVQNQDERWRGTFLAYMFTEQVDLGKYPILEFDYRIHRGVQVDLVASNVHGQLAVGLSDRSKTGRYLGEVPEFKADDRWHKGEFDLLSAVQKLGYRRKMYACQWIGVGDLGERFNAEGAYYRMDNVRLVPLVSGARGLDLTWRCSDAGGIKGYSYTWSTEPLAEPDDVIDSLEPRATFTDLPAPDAYLHIKACDRAGNWGPTEHLRFRVDATPPKLAAFMPADGDSAAPAEVTVLVQEAGSAIDPETLKVTIEGNVYGPDSPGVAYDPQAGKFVWNWLAGRPTAQRSIPNGKRVEVGVRAQDFAGNVLERQTAAWVMDYSRDRTAPPAPVIRCSGLDIHRLEDFETGLGNWRTVAERGSGGALLRRVRRNPARGDYCLEIVRQREAFSARALAGTYDLTRYPSLSFDCRIPPKVQVNLQVQINGTWLEVELTGARKAYPLLGKAEGLKADDSWQHVSLDLLGMARKLQPRARRYRVSSILVGNPGRNANASGARWQVDNFLISSFGKPVASFSWRTDDITGIKGYSVVFDQKPTTVPPAQAATAREQAVMNANAPGPWWLHVAACDGNGNWSPVTHLVYPMAPAN